MPGFVQNLEQIEILVNLENCAGVIIENENNEEAVIQRENQILVKNFVLFPANWECLAGLEYLDTQAGAVVVLADF